MIKQSANALMDNIEQITSKPNGPRTKATTVQQCAMDRWMRMWIRKRKQKEKRCSIQYPV